MPFDVNLETWASAGDVLKYTGENVDNTTLAQAQDIIELFCGVTWLANNQISERNQRILNRAVAYQAGWMPSRPDLFTHLDVETVSQDGASHTPATANAQLLAPFAARYLRRLSWADKPLRVQRGYNRTFYDDRGPRDSAAADDNKIWTPM